MLITLKLMSSQEMVEKVLPILEEKNLLQREVQTEEMAAEEVILFLSLTKTCGHFIILNLKNTSKLKMGEMVVNRGAQDQMVWIK